MQIEDIINYENLYNAMQKCKTNVLWKDSVASFYLNGVERCVNLENQLLNGSYRPRKPLKFFITSPKRREIISISFRDRVYQRALNDNYIYPVMVKPFIYDNWACQVGKGTDGARKRVKQFLWKEYTHNGNGGYCLKIDVKGYYPNMSHNYIEGLFADQLDPCISERAIRILKEQYDGSVGYNPGSQLVQIAGIAALNGLDHFVKERLRIKYYIRYMDDMLIIHSDKRVLESYLRSIQRKLLEYGFSINEQKTKIYSLDNGFEFLGFRYRLTDSGKIVMTINSESVRRERKKLRRAVNLAKNGVLTKEKVDEMYVSWKAHASKGNSYKLITRMDSFYRDLWRSNE